MLIVLFCCVDTGKWAPTTSTEAVCTPSCPGFLSSGMHAMTHHQNRLVPSSLLHGGVLSMEETVV